MFSNTVEDIGRTWELGLATAGTPKKTREVLEIPSANSSRKHREGNDDHPSGHEGCSSYPGFA